eukprot:jgi/Botrbrau1/23106/Bobra.0243s0041.3
MYLYETARFWRLFLIQQDQLEQIYFVSRSARSGKRLGPWLPQMPWGESCLKCNASSLEDMASSGVLLYCHKQSQKVHMVRSGSATAVIGELVHGLNLQVTTGKLPFTSGNWKTASTDDEAGIAELEYSELQLVPIHEHIILGTSQFWAYIAPDDAVLRSHLYLKSHVEGPEGTLPNSAAHLVLFAISKRRPSTGCPKGSGAMVLTLRWPSTSINQAFGDKPWLKQLAEHEHETASVRAVKRWQQLKMLYIEYTRSYRSMMHKRWYEAIDKLMAAGTRRARQVEEAFWKSNQMVVIASPSLKVRETNGRVVGKEEVQAVMKGANQIFDLNAYY